jgi:hypothetical protein
MAAKKSPTAEIADLQKRLAELDRERESVLIALEHLELRGELELQTAPQIVTDAFATSALSNADKITLFRSLFRGRDDVFPRRWENPKSGKIGYAPACRNEWIRGICDKPRLQQRLHVPRLNADHRQPRFGQSALNSHCDNGPASNPIRLKR